MIPIYIYSKSIFLSNYLAVPEEDLILALFEKDHSYESFTIPKSKGGYRRIDSVKKDSALFRIQQNFLRFYLNELPLPVCVKGFRADESYQKFLEEHCGDRFFLRIDLKDFFPSITSQHIEKAFRPLIRASDEEATWILNTLSSLLLFNDSLPQGACTSPAVSNFIFARLDQRILKYCQSLGIRYTRYADDLLFSESDSTGQVLSKPWFLKKIRYILASQSFHINYKKIKRSSSEISLNGFVVGTTIRLSRKRFTDISAVVSCCKQHLSSGSPATRHTLLTAVNSLSLKYRNLQLYPFKTIHALTQYIAGYRAYLLGWNTVSNLQTQQRILHLVSNMEKLIPKIEAL